MKRQRFVLSVLIALILALSMLLSACNVIDKGDASTGDSSSTGGSSTADSSDDSDDVDDPVIDVTYRTGYGATYFDASSVTYEAERIVDGLILVKNMVTKSDGNLSTVYALEIDLTKVDIAAGTSDNSTTLSGISKATPYQQATAYESATGKTVLASLNADFFGSTMVNAFVKDGVIVKSAHNDNGTYDYTDTASDVPASAPMLFGISGTTAQIAPIVNYTGDITSASVKQTVIQSSLTQKIGVLNSDSVYDVVLGQSSQKDAVAFNMSGTYTCYSGSLAVKVSLANGTSKMRILDKTICSEDKKFTATSDYGYIFVGYSTSAYTEFSNLSTSKIKYAVLSVSSPDGLWDGYTTILGCRQSLVEGGAVASTVALENTNGAQSVDVPRSAVGIKEDGTVVLFAVESLYYGKKSSDGDTHGMSLPQLADFMAFYGVETGANFDGGGSTQLIVNKTSGAEVIVRSSDTASYELTETRSVIESILVVSK